MKASDPLVSIIITTYFREERLIRAIDAALSQTHDPIEVIVVDDSGSRYAEDIVNEYESVQYVPHGTNRGQIAGWHTGFGTANGAYVQFNDDDDWLEPTKIEAQLGSLRKQENASVAYCGTKITGETDQTLRPSHEGTVLTEALGRDYLGQTTTLLIDSDVFADIVPLKEYPGATDIPLNIELAKRTEFVYVDDLLVNRENTDESKGSSKSAWEARLEILEDYKDLYQKVDGSIKSDVLSHTYFRLGCINMREGSGPTTELFLKAIYHRRFPHPRYLKYLLRSIVA